MTWVKIIAGALKLLNALASIFQTKQLKDAGRAEQRADDMSETNKRVDDAHAAVDRSRADPDRVLRYRD